ncbi:hypothetical protein E2C01_095954 [Portunus trituberculatus]|uniref:Uncharacterized protein n=1 Tax=Portunus trituberculatus TaxID=210409 RepID=A0A5B7JUD1_PORTR|nr:hypothetical protein [Portunus trituberculatus]
MLLILLRSFLLIIPPFLLVLHFVLFLLLLLPFFFPLLLLLQLFPSRYMYKSQHVLEASVSPRLPSTSTFLLVNSSPWSADRPPPPSGLSGGHFGPAKPSRVMVDWLKPNSG